MHLKNITRAAATLAGISMLSGCIVHEPSQSHVHQKIIRTINNDVANNQKLVQNEAADASTHQNLKAIMNTSLVPDINVKPITTPDEKKFNVDAVDIPANKFFMSLVKGTPYNIVVDPDVTGNISLELNNVTVPDVISAASSAYGYQYKKTSYGYRIEAKRMETKIFTLNYLDVDRQGTSNMRISPSTITDVLGTSGGSASGGSSAGGSSMGGASSGAEASNVKTISKNNFWVELATTLNAMIGDKDGRKVVVNPESGLVIIHAYPNEIRTAGRYFDKLQKIMTRQVILEAKILEVSLSANFQSGIQWKAMGINFDGTQKLSGELEDPTSIFSIHTIVNPDFSAVINLLNTQGKTEVLSSPRIATMNNQKAIIKVGQDQFFVTNVSSTTTGSATAQVTQDVNFTPFFSGISLDVTPEIDRENNVILHIHPVISTVVEDTKSFVLGSQNTQNLPLAKSTIRESDTIVHAKNGEVIVIGGLMENNMRSFDGSVPGFDRTALRDSFGRHDKQAAKVELVILLKPIVVNNTSTWTDRLSTAKNVYQSMNSPFVYTVHTHKKSDDT